MHLFQPSLAYTILNLVAELLAAGDEHAEYWPCSRLSVLQLFRRVFSLSFNGVLFWDSWQQDRKVQSAHFALYPRRSHWYKDTLEFRLFQSQVFFSCSKCLRPERNDCKEEFTNIPHPPEYVQRLPGFHEKKKEMRVFNRRNSSLDLRSRNCLLQSRIFKTQYNETSWRTLSYWCIYQTTMCKKDQKGLQPWAPWNMSLLHQNQSKHQKSASWPILALKANVWWFEVGSAGETNKTPSWRKKHPQTLVA